jgi:hypothetical protein
MPIVNSGPVTPAYSALIDRLPSIEPEDVTATVLTFALTGVETGGMAATLGVEARVNTCELAGVLTLDTDLCALELNDDPPLFV